MPTLNDFLTAHPYKTTYDDPTYIAPNDFYCKTTGVYVPAKDCSNIRKVLSENPNHAIIIRLNGYAGCGKTMFAHYLMYCFGSVEQFFYSFDEGEGENYDLKHVKNHIITILSSELAKQVKYNPDCILKFEELGEQFSCDDPCSTGLLDLLSSNSKTGKDFSEATKMNASELPRIKAKMRKAILSAVETVEKTDGSMSDVLRRTAAISFLLTIDYLLRHALTLCQKDQTTSNQREERIVAFCLLDNLDNLRRDVIADLYIAIFNVIKNINNFYRENQDYENSFLANTRLVYLFPTRAVTYQKLRDELRARKKEKILNKPGVTYRVELALDSEMHGRIIQKRLTYWKRKRQLKPEQKDALVSIGKLIKTRFEKDGSFSALFNNNYSLCVDRILDFYEKRLEWENLQPHFLTKLSDECVAPLFPVDTLSKNNVETKHIRNAAEVAQKGVFLRILLEILKEGSAFASPYDQNSKNHFEVSSKLGLIPLDSQFSEPPYGVSLSRLILTYLRSKEKQVAHLNELFECFSDYDTKTICRCVYALSENIRDVWRRLVMFNSRIPSKIEDLYDQADSFAADKEIDYTEIQLCRAGEEYLKVVAPSFEFFLSRLDQERNNLESYPPLFSSQSIKTGKWKIDIEAVLQAVESCAKQLHSYDIWMIDKLLASEKEAEIQHLFAPSRKSDSIKQTHLARIVFSHVSYIEHFRVYYLHYWEHIESEGRNKPIPMDKRIEANERIVSYIIRYLTLFKDSWTEDPFYAPLLENRFLYDKNEESLLQKGNDCFSVHDHLVEKGFIPLGVKNGFKNQERAQLTLLDCLLEIHNTGYQKATFTIPVLTDRISNVRKDTRGNKKQ